MKVSTGNRGMWLYPFVNELDTLLRETGFSSINWRQTAPCHWALVANK